jgi:hypothetical protein
MSQPIGTNEEFLNAAHLINSNPLAISEYQMRVLRSTHPHFADQAEREQAEARSKLALEKQREQKDARRRADEAARALPPVANARFLSEDESPAAWWTRNEMALAPVWLVQSVNDAIQQFLAQMNQKNMARNERITALETKVEGLLARAGGDTGQDSMVEGRLKALESKPAITYEGVWSVDRAYGVGMMVTHQGGIWHAKTANVSRRPGTDPNVWTLAVKSGRDGKDAA